MSQLQPTIEEYLNDYNAESKQPMPLVMFMDAIGHVARITRVLRQPKGNMLLLGVGGSGRQSLSRLSTFMAECKIFSIEITKGYGADAASSGTLTVPGSSWFPRRPVGVARKSQRDLALCWN